MDNTGRRPHVFARVEPETRERIRVEAGRLYDGNESMLVRRAIVRFLDDIEEQRRRAGDIAVNALVTEKEPVAA